MAKWRLTKLLYQRDWDKQRIINLYRVIDWIMRLPEGLEARLRLGMLQIERRKAMTYLSSIERIGMEIGRKEGLKEGRLEGLQEGRQEGRQEGKQEGWAEGLTMVLSQRFGRLDAKVLARIAEADVPQLSAWARNFVDATSLDEVFRAS
ncbi:hypothetical protein RugamoR57_25360 [Duganella caerulea]|uniref:hypothetical protein n=1 Tax=Duganella caerulea TaxID=2885762 RepID=UPI0030E8101B